MKLCVCTKFHEYILNGFQDVKHKSTSLMVLNKSSVERQYAPVEVSSMKGNTTLLELSN